MGNIKTSYSWGVPGGRLSSFVVMECNHDEVPVSVTNVPSNPRWGVSVEYQGQKDYIGDDQDGASQCDHQTHKHLHNDRVGGSRQSD